MTDHADLERAWTIGAIAGFSIAQVECRRVRDGLEIAAGATITEGMVRFAAEACWHAVNALHSPLLDTVVPADPENIPPLFDDIERVRKSLQAKVALFRVAGEA